MFRFLLEQPEGLLVVTFAGIILLGAGALCLPVCHAAQPIGFIDALFTSTSAVCVTGLTTVDTATAWSRTGQIVILALIQIGGLGIMTFAALGAQVFRAKLSFSSQLAWQGSFFETADRGELRRSVASILILTFVIELAGTVLLYAAAAADPELDDHPFYAVFHAISAFCNAGFSIYTDNAVAMRGSLLSLFTIMGLIVAGGLGYTVVLELLHRFERWVRRKPANPLKWSLQTRVVLRVSLYLIVGGAVVLVMTGLTHDEDTWSEQIVHALFQSVTARTAGFNTIGIAALPMASLLVLILLMYIGGSPGSCAGGIKTTSAAVWVARVRARLLSQEDVTLLDRRIPRDVVRRSALVISVATIWNLVGVFLLAITEGGHDGVRLDHLIFEQISAFGTVGLSANVTPTLSELGRLWITLTMFIGRVGPLTVALVVIAAPRALHHLPNERLMIG